MANAKAMKPMAMFSKIKVSEKSKIKPDSLYCIHYDVSVQMDTCE